MPALYLKEPTVIYGFYPLATRLLELTSNLERLDCFHLFNSEHRSKFSTDLLVVWAMIRNMPFATNDHMVQNPPYWRASSLLFPHWDIKTKRPQSIKRDWRFLYHVIVCCKRPIVEVQFVEMTGTVATKQADVTKLHVSVVWACLQKYSFSLKTETAQWYSLSLLYLLSAWFLPL